MKNTFLRLCIAALAVFNPIHAAFAFDSTTDGWKNGVHVAEDMSDDDIKNFVAAGITVGLTGAGLAGVPGLFGGIVAGEVLVSLVYLGTVGAVSTSDVVADGTTAVTDAPQASSDYTSEQKAEKALRSNDLREFADQIRLAQNDAKAYILGEEKITPALQAVLEDIRSRPELKTIHHFSKTELVFGIYLAAQKI